MTEQETAGVARLAKLLGLQPSFDPGPISPEVLYAAVMVAKTRQEQIDVLCEMLNRGTGKTTQKILLALYHASCGRQVTYVTQSYRNTRHLSRRFSDYAAKLGIRATKIELADESDLRGLFGRTLVRDS